MNNPMLVAALVCGGIGCLVVLIAMSTPGWTSAGEGRYATTIGLFSVCTSLGCASYSAEGSIAACKAFMVMAFFLTLAAIIISIVYFFKYVRNSIANRNLPLAAGVCYLVGAGLALLGAIIFAAKANSDIAAALSIKPTLGYSFALAIVGALICGASGALTMVHRKNSSE